MKIFKRVAIYVMVATLSVGTVGLVANSTTTTGQEHDGDIITNPWGEYFTKPDGSGDLPVDKETEKKPEQTTKKQQTSTVTLKKAKVKSAKKKKSSKKVKVSLKKIKDANKYQVQISTKKKFKKVLVKKTVKKVKFTLKSKKIKNKKKLYIRAKAVKTVGKNVYTGKWSKPKKIKIKK